MTEKKKIIDAKGRLFGKVNLIDLIVLALVIVIGLVLCAKLMGKSSGIPGAAAGTELEYTVKVSRVAPEVFASVEHELTLGGDHVKLMASGEMLEGSSVLSAVATPHMETVPMDNGALVSSVEGEYVDVLFTIRAVVTNPITQAVGTQEVRIGRSHIIKTKTFEIVNGIILTCAPTAPEA